MRKLLIYIKGILPSLYRSIAFLPSIISFGSILFALACLRLEDTEIIRSFKDNVNFMVVDGLDNARTVLSVIFSSMVSLMVFSFTMVMLILNRASANFSPRVIPGIISQRFHQVVLGCYLGTILFSLIIIINLDPGDIDSPAAPGFSLLINFLMVIGSLILFVFFIHQISQYIQIDQVMRNTYRRSHHLLHEKKEMLSKVRGRHDEPERPDMDGWCVHDANHGGYFISIKRSRLVNLLNEHDLQLRVIARRGDMVPTGAPLFSLDKDAEEEVVDKLRSCFNIQLEHLPSEDYERGLLEMSEVAVKALSPGINDPGTAINVINYMGLVLIELLGFEPESFVRDEDGDPRIWLREADMDSLLHRYVEPIRHYGRSDTKLISALIRFYSSLLVNQEASDADRDMLAGHLRAALEDANDGIYNSFDRERINEILEEAKGRGDFEWNIPNLKVESRLDG